MKEYRDIDFDTINEWSIQNGFELDKELLSPLGYIDSNIYCSVYVAVGANCIFVDNFITNPESSPIGIKNSLRDLHDTIKNLLLSWKGLWCVRITATAAMAGVIERLGGIVDPDDYKQIFFIV